MMTDEQIDNGILSAIQPAAADVEAAYHGNDEPQECLVTWAVVTFEYLDRHGERQHGYRRVNASWFDLAGSSKMLEAAHAHAWTIENLGDE